VGDSEKKMSHHAFGAFVVTRISPTVISLLHISANRDTSSSPCSSVISMPEFYFIVIASMFEVLISYLSLVKYILCYLAYLVVCWCTYLSLAYLGFVLEENKR
jgi:hypothetical protein